MYYQEQSPKPVNGLYCTDTTDTYPLPKSAADCIAEPFGWGIDENFLPCDHNGLMIERILWDGFSAMSQDEIALLERIAAENPPVKSYIAAAGPSFACAYAYACSLPAKGDFFFVVCNFGGAKHTAFLRRLPDLKLLMTPLYPDIVDAANYCGQPPDELTVNDQIVQTCNVVIRRSSSEAFHYEWLLDRQSNKPHTFLSFAEAHQWIALKSCPDSSHGIIETVRPEFLIVPAFERAFFPFAGRIYKTHLSDCVTLNPHEWSLPWQKGAYLAGIKQGNIMEFKKLDESLYNNPTRLMEMGFLDDFDEVWQGLLNSKNTGCNRFFVKNQVTIADLNWRPDDEDGLDDGC